jgi:hypothetical protein
VVLFFFFAVIIVIALVIAMIWKSYRNEKQALQLGSVPSGSYFSILKILFRCEAQIIRKRNN